ncbi:MAG: hypothetical protein EXS10_10915 [Phycisphaerales bacterium]|nr:hypothetical protein [Phycisphaerales bacterium]
MKTRPLDLGLDDPEVSNARGALLQRHAYLHRLYTHWYEQLRSELPQREGDVLELGSGGGFLRDVIANVITSDVMKLTGVDRIIDASRLSFADDSLRAIVATNVLHHIPHIEIFFGEAERIIMSRSTSPATGRLKEVAHCLPRTARFLGSCSRGIENVFMRCFHDFACSGSCR